VRVLERDPQLAVLDGHLAQVAAGQGRLALISGEAGVGKTTLVDTWCQRHDGDIRLLRGVCDGSATPRPLGPFIDAFPQLAGSAGTPDWSRLPATISEGLQAVGGVPTVLVIEDAHWADGASLDLLRALVMRMARIPALVVLTYRSEEVDPAHPLGVLVGDVVGRPAVDRYEVPGLSVEAVRTLTAEAGVDLDVAQLHRRTGGNAFHVTEVLAAGGETVPTSVRDAVRARVSRLAPDSRAAVEVVALAGLRAEPEVVEDVLGDAAAAADEAVRRGVLRARPEGLQFRHDLARRAVEDDIAPMRRLALHRAILTSLLARPALGDPARVAYHAEQARDFAAALTAATEAAERSAALGAHREAVQQYERALRVAPGAAEQHLGLLEGLSYELYLTGRIDEAITVQTRVLQINQNRDDRAGIASSHRWMSRLHYFGGHGAAASAHAKRAVELLDPDVASAEAAMVLSNQAQLCMLHGDTEGTRRWGRRALQMARTVAAVEVEVHALINLGTVERYMAGPDARATRLEEALERAISAGMHEHAARAYSNLVSAAVTARDLDEAERWAEPAVSFCADRDLDAWRFYLDGQVAQLRLHQGRLDEARRTAAHILRQPQVPAINRVLPLIVLGLAQARTGEPAAGTTLAHAVSIAERTMEVQRLGPAISALAELSWLRGDPWPDLLRSVHATAGTTGSGWTRGELASWMDRAGWLTDRPTDLASPYALQLASRWEDAARGWAALGCRYEQALALAEAPDVGSVVRAVHILTELGATAAVARLSSRVTALGGRVTHPRRQATRDHPAGLTARQAEVLELLADGASNGEVAARLGISARTAEHHVSAVLARLGVATRAEAVVLATDRGWVHLGTG
jgi:DNA-binding CsgD family transcriptional regulator/tetratricopeptide (TPR) repeat protein